MAPEPYSVDNLEKTADQGAVATSEAGPATEALLGEIAARVAEIADASGRHHARAGRSSSRRRATASSRTHGSYGIDLGTTYSVAGYTGGTAGSTGPGVTR